MYITPYIFVEDGPQDLTLIDSCFRSELPKLVTRIQDEGFDIRNEKRLILTHTHVDHVQSANEIKSITGAKVFSHWLEAGFLSNDPPYYGPPDHSTVLSIMRKVGVDEDKVNKKFGSLGRDPVAVDHILSDGDSIGGLKVVHTPGHTPGHISLYSEQDNALIGGDFLFNRVLGEDGLFLPKEVSIDTKLGGVSARRVSGLNFDKLLLAHQKEPELDSSAPKKVDQAAETLLKKN